MSKKEKSRKVFHIPNGKIVVKGEIPVANNITFVFKQGNSKTSEMVEKIIKEMRDADYSMWYLKDEDL